MSKKTLKSRRDFVKKTAVGVTSIIAASSGINEVFPKNTNSAQEIIEINPDIDNLRVVYIEDPEMLQDGSDTTFENFSAANEKVNSDCVKRNMDQMAFVLTGGQSSCGWEVIFQKPAHKEWEEVIVAIKPNCAAGTTDGLQYPHASIAIVNATCEALIDLGVQASKITLYDTNGFSVNPSTLYPADLMVSGIKFLGPSTRTYPTPMWSSISKAAIEADIIVNLASCKGHAELGGTTLSMKNHLGTVGGHVSGAQAVQQLIDIHNSQTILGTPVPGTLPPKQQLIMVDCLWSAAGGPLVAPDKAPCMIVMGTSSPAVDCFTAIKVRLEKLKYSGIRETYLSYLTKYGYAASDVEPLLENSQSGSNKGWIDANNWLSGTSIKCKNSALSKNKIITFSISNSGFKSINYKFLLPLDENIQTISIMNIKGQQVNNFQYHSVNNNTIRWDGRNHNGKTVSSGTYIVSVSGKKNMKTIKISLSK